MHTHALYTVEYQTLILCTPKLRTAASSDLTRLSGCLLAKGLISRDNDSELRNRHTEVADRAARLVELVQQKVNLDTQNYTKFIEILKENQFDDILKILSDSEAFTQGNVIDTIAIVVKININDKKYLLLKYQV